MGPYLFEALTNTNQGSCRDLGGFGMPLVAFNLVTVELPDTNGVLVRRSFVATPEVYRSFLELGYSADQISHAMFPDTFGARPMRWGAPVSPIEHLMGNELSSYLTAGSSSRSSLMSLGRNVYFDIATLKRLGIKLVSPEELKKSLEAYVARYPHLEFEARNALRWHLSDGNVLIKAEAIPGAAIYSQTELNFYMVTHKLFRVAGVVGVALTAYDLARAGHESVQVKSVKPLARELIKQAGGWGGAWAGFQIGGAVGAAMGVELGPGLALTGLVGGITFGIGGYYGAAWVSDAVIE